MEAGAPPIGGFFEFHEPGDGPPGTSVLQAWTGGRPYASFANARSAFAALAALHPQATLRLPAFLCTDLMDPSYAARVERYPVLEGFAPDLDYLGSATRAGDLVLVVAYFGLPARPDMREFAARRPDLRFVEDRAQALDCGEMWSDWCLYSPRKLMGVADGGLLVGRDAGTLPPQPAAMGDAAQLWTPLLMRYEDPAGERSVLWHRANQAKEAALSTDSVGMSRLSLSLLSRIALASLAEPRLRNWRTLDARLRPWSALPAGIAAPPLGYVIRLPQERRDRVLAGLHAARIFAAVHWAGILGPADRFPREHGWTRELITLPCDHRYGAADMHRVAACVTDLLQ